jgi:adenosylcobinamide kinase/adenosylcobinamide-phosphate guanylyltransferase
VYFVTGGAFQGKRNWVQHLIGNQVKNPHFWINGYVQDLPSLKEINNETNTIIIEGMEKLIHNGLKEDKQRECWKQELQSFIDWEKLTPERNLIIIGCEIGLGVVPMNKQDRLHRDLVGWVYQDIAKQSDNVVRIWCGLPEKLKEEAQ